MTLKELQLVQLKEIISNQRRNDNPLTDLIFGLDLCLTISTSLPDMRQDPAKFKSKRKPLRRELSCEVFEKQRLHLSTHVGQLSTGRPIRPILLNRQDDQVTYTEYK